jgi:hypothetical protein
MALFYWITFNPTTRRGGFWPGGFYQVLDSARPDWGNPVHRAFMDAVASWEPRVLAIGADGFFKVAIRRHPSAECWSWAVEWNHQLRAVGFFGDRQVAEEIAGRFPQLKVEPLVQRPGRYLGYRNESPLQDGDDKLFYWSHVTTEAN